MGAPKINIQSVKPGTLTLEYGTVSLTQQATELLKAIEGTFLKEPEVEGDELKFSKLRKLVLLDQLKAVNKATEKLISELRAPLETEIMAMLEQLGTNNFNIDGRTVYLHREFWAKVKEFAPVGEDASSWRAVMAERALQALKANEETRPFVKESFNTQTLSAYFRERRVKHDEEFEQMESRAVEDGVIMTETEIEERIETPIFPTSELAAVLDFSEKTSIRSRTGGGK